MAADFDPTLPFVLIDDARAGGARARLFTGLIETIAADTPAEVAPALDRLRGTGPFAGFVGFEAGYAIEPKLAGLARVPDDGLPLLWFGRFARAATVDTATLLGDSLGSGCVGWVGDVVPDIAPADHAAMVACVADLIAAGDIYQANVTFQAQVAIGGHPVALYRALRAAQAAPHGALVHTGTRWILSFSPELFFSMVGRTLVTRPMKGTAPRGASTAEDDANAAELAADSKNRAENLMIVDLLRNDLSRVSDTVNVSELFHVEHYPTVLQMTSTITATAHLHVMPADVLAAMFPCGSVTGAPKIRAMEVIAAIERKPRGLYTGSIGYIAGSDAAFNVAIRTLVLQPGGTARIGLGSGIVADSDAASEWTECIAKAAFLRRRNRPVDIIETMRFDPDSGANLGGIARRDRHLARAAATARYLGTPFDAAAASLALDHAVAEIDAARRVRLLVAASGAVTIEVSALPPPLSVAEVVTAPLPVAADDWRLVHKTTDRDFYDTARRASGAAEVVFVLPDGRVTEGSFTSIFVDRGGVLLTPAGPGLLPGILRAELIDTGRAVAVDLTPADLADGFFIGNSLRGLVPSKLRRGTS